jgi:hypothetical protein
VTSNISNHKFNPHFGKTVDLHNWVIMNIRRRISGSGLDRKIIPMVKLMLLGSPNVRDFHVNPFPTSIYTKINKMVAFKPVAYAWVDFLMMTGSFSAGGGGGMCGGVQVTPPQGVQVLIMRKF